MFQKIKICLLLTLACQLVLCTPFEIAIEQAQESDNILKALELQSEAWQVNNQAILPLPNTTLGIGVMNVGTDGFDLNSEAMTQNQIKISQRLPKRGWKRWQKKQNSIQIERHHWLIEDRKAWLYEHVGSLWLDVHLKQAIISLRQELKQSLKQLTISVQNRYQSGIISTDQADILKARLAVTAIDQKVIVDKRNLVDAQSALTEWLTHELEPLPPELPTINHSPFTDLTRHPKILALSQENTLADLQIEKSEFNQQPQWSFQLAYGHRQNDPAGQNRSDLASIGITFDLPIFNRKHHNQATLRAALLADAQQQNWQQLIKQFETQRELSINHLESQMDMLSVYKEQLIPQTEALISSLLTGYSQGANDLDEVILAQQNLTSHQIQKTIYQHEQLKSLLKLGYYNTIGVPL